MHVTEWVGGEPSHELHEALLNLILILFLGSAYNTFLEVVPVMMVTVETGV